jgi:predicted RNA methylase
MSMVEMHRLMLRDAGRNSAYDRAICKLVGKGDRVLDLGAGTGLLAMMAARAGADQVVAVEAADVVTLGRAVTKANGLQDRIVWKAMPSTELTLKQRCNVLVTETFGSHPFEECTHEFVRDARERLCTHDVRVIPARVRVYAAPATFADQRDDWDLFAQKIAGFSFAPLREHTRGQMYAESLAPASLLAPPVLLEDIELGGPAPSKRKLQASWMIAQAGTFSGIVQWYELQLAPDIVLSTAERTHWRQIHYPHDRNVALKKGAHVDLTIAQDTRIEVPLSVRYTITVR